MHHSYDINIPGVGQIFLPGNIAVFHKLDASPAKNMLTAGN